MSLENEMPSEELKEIDDLARLFLDDVPLLDVRAPVEFAEGAFPCAENLPLIDDEERHRIGITYKEEGQDQAIELGEQLVSGDRKARRIAARSASVDRMTSNPTCLSAVSISRASAEGLASVAMFS